MNPRYRLMTRGILVALLVAIMAACSPEAGRPRGGGPGAMGSNVPPDGVVPASKVFSTTEP